MNPNSMTAKPEGLKPCPVCKLSHCISKGVGPCVTVEPVPLTVTAWNTRSSPVGAGEPDLGLTKLTATPYSLSDLEGLAQSLDQNIRTGHDIPSCFNGNTLSRLIAQCCRGLLASPVGGIDREGRDDDVTRRGGGSAQPLTTPEPNPEWEAKADAAHAAIVAEVGEPNPFDTLKMLETWKAHAEPADSDGRISFSRALLDSAQDALRVALNIARNEHLAKKDEFRRGAQAARHMLANFVEQGGDAVTANSIRLNWNPSWGDDPGQPSPCGELQGGWLGPHLSKKASAAITRTEAWGFSDIAKADQIIALAQGVSSSGADPAAAPQAVCPEGPRSAGGRTPEPEFCRRPECVGLARCPRDPVCND